MPGLTFDLDLPPDSPALSDAQHAAGDNVESSVFRQTAALGHLGLEDRPPADPAAGSGAAARAMPASEEQSAARARLSQMMGREVRPEDVKTLQAAAEHIGQLPIPAT